MAITRNGYFWTLTAALVASLALVPLVTVIQSLLFGDREAFGHLASTILPSYALNTALLMVMVGTLSTVTGVSTAWLVSSSSFWGRRFWSWVLVLPIAAPAYIIAYLYTDLFTFSGPVQSSLRALFGWSASDYWFPQIRSLPGAAVMLSLVLYPYVYLLARASFAAQSRSQLLAARTLGLSAFDAFWRVALPGARPAIVGGLALVLMETLADFGVADYFAIPTFSTGIFRTWFALGDRSAAMQLAGVMLLFVAVLVTVEVSTRRGQVASSDRLSTTEPPFALSGRQTILANCLCALPVTLGFVVPMLLLVNNVFTELDSQPLGVLSRFVANSLGTAASTATNKSMT
ncbi:MAG: ABC transporter permease subunit, partial [Pseudomonadota bacterium]